MEEEEEEEEEDAPPHIRGGQNNKRPGALFPLWTGGQGGLRYWDLSRLTGTSQSSVGPTPAIWNNSGHAKNKISVSLSKETSETLLSAPSSSSAPSAPIAPLYPIATQPR